MTSHGGKRIRGSLWNGCASGGFRYKKLPRGFYKAWDLYSLHTLIIISPGYIDVFIFCSHCWEKYIFHYYSWVLGILAVANFNTWNPWNCWTELSIECSSFQCSHKSRFFGQLVCWSECDWACLHAYLLYVRLRFIGKTAIVSHVLLFKWENLLPTPRHYPGLFLWCKHGSVGWLVHHFGSDWNIYATAGCIAMNFSAIMFCVQGMNPNDSLFV